MEKFHENVGKNIDLSSDFKAAEKKEKREMKSSIVCSKRSLRDNVIFTIKVEDTRFQGSSNVSIGVMYCDPARLSFGRDCMTDQLRDGVWMLHGKGLYLDGERRADYATDIKVSIGDTLGVMRTSRGVVHYYKNGVDQGAAEGFDKVPRDVWAVVGLEWAITKISAQPSGLDLPKENKHETSSSSLIKNGGVEKIPYYMSERPKAPSPSIPKTRDPIPSTPKTRDPTPSTPTYRAPTPSTPKTRAPTPSTPKTRAPTPSTPKTRDPTPSTPITIKPYRTETPKPVPKLADDIARLRGSPVLGEIRKTHACRSEPRLDKIQGECPYRKKCLIVKEKLRLHDAFFDPGHDVCFCRKCYLGRGDNSYYTRGEPPKKYGLPVGWYKFGLRTPAKAESLDVFKKWHVAFHGTKPTTVNSILNTGDLLMPGDVTIEGEEVRPPANHFDDQSADPTMKPPSGHDIKKFYLSPSIKYAGCEAYAPAFILTDPTTLDQFDARVALQVRIMPESYEVGRETIGAGYKRVDDMFSNLDLEWATRRRGAIVLVGFLVRVEGYEDISGAATTDLMRLGPRLTQA